MPLGRCGLGAEPANLNAILDKHRGTIPRAFLRALAKLESNFNTKLIKGTGKNQVRGLYSIRPMNVADYNVLLKRMGLPEFTHADMNDPDKATQLIVWALKRRMLAMAKTGDENMRPGWDNPDFIKLLYMSWNAGWSKAAGLLRVADYMLSRGIPITHDNVLKYAKVAGAASVMYSKAKHDYQKRIWPQYQTELKAQLLPSEKQPLGPAAATQIIKEIKERAEAPKRGGLWVLLLLAILWLRSRR